MSVCICCAQGHPKEGAKAGVGDEWCQQCQKDGCPDPHFAVETESRCAVREHAGLEKVLHKMGMNEKLMPDPELGQDVAFLAHTITINQEVMKNIRKYFDEIREATKESLGDEAQPQNLLQARHDMAEEFIEEFDKGTFIPKA